MVFFVDDPLIVVDDLLVSVDDIFLSFVNNTIIQEKIRRPAYFIFFFGERVIRYTSDPPLVLLLIKNQNVNAFSHFFSCISVL